MSVLLAALGYVVPFLFVLAIVVIVHELGHFLVARWCGVEVKVFSIGFGPEVVGFNDRKGTRWRLAAIPLGGYVKFLGDSDAASTPDGKLQRSLSAAEQARSFPHQPVGNRAAIVAAGPIANFLLAIAVFAGSVYISGRQVLTARIDTVLPDSAAAAAGLRSGDLVVSINGSTVHGFGEMQRTISISAGVPLTLVVERGGVETTLVATPRLREIRTAFGIQRIGVLGIQGSRDPADLRSEELGLIASLNVGLQETWFVIERTGAYVGGLVSGRESTDQLSGPIRIAKISGQVASDGGFAALVTLAAFLSVSIGLVNLLPIPMLDGGHLVFYAIEWGRGRPLSERAQELGFRFGLGFVLLLVLFVTWNDIVNLRAS